MNTRLQVEHPVTEETTGLDLVELQFAVASGARLPAEPPPTVGHAIEVRLYAEDPLNDWQPQTGVLRRFEIPPSLRTDSGVEDGSEVSPYYDAMLAKVISVGSDRTTVARRLAAELERATVHGVGTNRDLLVWILRHPAFLAGETDTAFFEKHGVGEPVDDAVVRVSALAAALVDAAARQTRAPVRVASGWRNLPSQPQRKSYRAGAVVHEVEYQLTRAGLVADGNVRIIESGPERVMLEVDGVRRVFDVAAYDGLVCVDSSLGSVSLTPVERFTDPAQQVAAGSLVAPMPGTVIRVGVQVGDTVKQGQPLLWLEAMKMEHTIAAPVDGVVGELKVEAGQQIEVGAVLAVVGEEA